MLSSILCHPQVSIEIQYTPYICQCMSECTVYPWMAKLPGTTLIIYLWMSRNPSIRVSTDDQVMRISMDVHIYSILTLPEYISDINIL